MNLLYLSFAIFRTPDASRPWAGEVKLLKPRLFTRQLLLATLLPLLLNLFSAAAAAQSISFSSPAKYGSGGTASTAVCAGDFNGDGKADLAVANQNSYNIGILLGKGDGTFYPVSSFSAGYSPRAITSVDLNLDGKLDLVVANETGNDLSVLVGNGDATFMPALNYGPIDRPEHIVAADLNLDGMPDLAVAGFGGTLFVLNGNGDGTLQTPTSYATGAASKSSVAGDFNKDGKPDLAVANQDSGNLSVLLNSGDGTFSPAASYTTAPYPTSITLGDFNRDGNPDLATTDIGTYSNGYISGNGFVSILLGRGDGTFQEAVNYSVGLVPYSAVVCDLNGDGLPDVVVANAYSNSITVLVGRGDGTFATSMNFVTGEPSTPFSLALSDFNGDQKDDIATANFVDSSISVLINQTAQSSLMSVKSANSKSSTNTRPQNSKPAHQSKSSR